MEPMLADTKIYFFSLISTPSFFLLCTRTNFMRWFDPLKCHAFYCVCQRHSNRSQTHCLPSHSGVSIATGCKDTPHNLQQLTGRSVLSLSLLAGRPPPKVTWWRDDTELIGTSHTSVEEGATVMVNQLLIGTTTRDFYGIRIECRAQGTRLVDPVRKDVTVQVYCESSTPQYVQ